MTDKVRTITTELDGRSGTWVSYDDYKKIESKIHEAIAYLNTCDILRIEPSKHVMRDYLEGK